MSRSTSAAAPTSAVSHSRSDSRRRTASFMDPLFFDGLAGWSHAQLVVFSGQQLLGLLRERVLFNRSLQARVDERDDEDHDNEPERKPLGHFEMHVPGC